MRYWRLIAHHDDKDAAVNEIRRLKRVSVGWGKIGTLLNRDFDSPDKIRDSIRIHYPDLGNSVDGGRVLWAWAHEIEEGDMVWVKGDKREVLVRVSSPYYYHDVDLTLPGYAHHHSVEIIHTGSRFPSYIGPIPGRKQRSTLVEYEEKNRA